MQKKMNSTEALVEAFDGVRKLMEEKERELVELGERFDRLRDAYRTLEQSGEITVIDEGRLLDYLVFRTEQAPEGADWIPPDWIPRVIRLLRKRLEARVKASEVIDER